MDHMQTRVVSVGVRAFGIDSMSSLEERTMRFAEEAAELLQARGLPLPKLLTIFGHVYGRPVGDVPQEIAGAAVTLYALAHTEGVKVDDVVTAEVDRIDQNIAKIRAKAALKPDHLFAVRPIPPEVDGGGRTKSSAANGGGLLKTSEERAS